MKEIYKKKSYPNYKPQLYLNHSSYNPLSRINPQREMDNLIKDLIKQYSELEKYKSNNPFCNNHKSELKKNIDYNFDKFINLKQQLQYYYFSTQDFKPIIYKMQEAKNDFNN